MPDAVVFAKRGDRKKKDLTYLLLEQEEIFEILLKPNKISLPTTSQQFAENPVQKKASVAPAKPPQEIKAPPIRKRVKIDSSFDSGLVSIKSIKKKKTEESQVAEQEAELLTNKPKTEFTEEQFFEVWNKYVDILKNTGKASFANTLEVSDPKLIGETVTLEIENTVQEAALATERADLLGYIRKELNNYHIALNYNKVEVKEEVRYYTNKERFNRLAELNPKLLDLKKRFNLDTEF